MHGGTGLSVGKVKGPGIAMRAAGFDSEGLRLPWPQGSSLSLSALRLALRVEAGRGPWRCRANSEPRRATGTPVRLRRRNCGSMPGTMGRKAGQLGRGEHGATVT